MNPQTCLATPILLIWRWICFYAARPERTGENQLVTSP